MRRPSLGLLARLCVPVGGRVRKLRAVEGHWMPAPGGNTHGVSTNLLIRVLAATGHRAEVHVKKAAA